MTFRLEDDEELAGKVASLIVNRLKFDDTSSMILALVSKHLNEKVEEDRFSKVLAVFREYLLDLDHDIEGCGPGELDIIDQHREATLELRRRLVAHVTEGANARGQQFGGSLVCTSCGRRSEEEAISSRPCPSARGHQMKYEPLEPALFYIQDTRSYVGDVIIWWRPKGKGDTTVLGDAGLFTAKEVGGLRETDRLVPMWVARRAARITVSEGDLEASLAKEKK